MRNNKNLVSASILVVLISIVSFLIFRQVNHNKISREASLLEQTVLEEDIDEGQDEYYELEEESEDLKHEVFITDDVNLDWFHSNIEKINGVKPV